jgi:hypothetical protein
MKYDLIIACGDSFTEGCKDLLNISIDKTWPGLLAESLGIPFVNLAIGGACNLEIALQPLKNATPEDLQIMHQSKCPLILFNFTVMERIPYPSYRAGVTESCFSILPEHTLIQRAPWLDEPIKEMLVENCVNTDVECQLDASTMNQSLDDQDLREIDWFVFSTMQAIRVCMNWEKLIPNSTVAWGFIHINTSHHGEGLDNYQLETEQVPLRYPYISRCYNKFLNMKEVQSVMYDENLEMNYDYTISRSDIHPNKIGIRMIANWFEDYIRANL